MSKRSAPAFDRAPQIRCGRKHDIENHDVDALVDRLVTAVDARVECHDDEAFGPSAPGQSGRQSWLILDEQDSPVRTLLRAPCPRRINARRNRYVLGKLCATTSHDRRSLVRGVSRAWRRGYTDTPGTDLSVRIRECRGPIAVRGCR